MAWREVMYCHYEGAEFDDVQFQRANGRTWHTAGGGHWADGGGPGPNPVGNSDKTENEREVEGHPELGGRQGPE